MHNISSYIIEKLKINKDSKPEKEYLKISDDEAIQLISSACQTEDDLAGLMDKYFEDWYFDDPHINRNNPKSKKYFEDEYNHIIKTLQQMGVMHTLKTACPIKFIKYFADILYNE